MDTRVITVTNDGIKRTHHNEWSLKDCFECVSNDVDITDNTSFKCTASRHYSISKSYDRLSIVDECVDFSIHLDIDEIDLVDITIYDNTDKQERKMELYTRNAEFHITMWF